MLLLDNLPSWNILTAIVIMMFCYGMLNAVVEVFDVLLTCMFIHVQCLYILCYVDNSV